MRIVLAQIDMRLGDIDAICARIADQAALAARAQADLLCIPAAPLCSVVPGELVFYANYEHDLTRALASLAADLERTDVACLVPAAVAHKGGVLFEAFLLRDGAAVPLRSTLCKVRQETPIDPWLPAVFDIAGTRVAVSFDAARDISELPPGCDLLIYFPSDAFDMARPASAPALLARDDEVRQAVRQAGVWMACAASVGAYDELVYAGGSFVLDDAARVIALAPSFEEHLLVQEVRRGALLDALPDFELPAYDREEWAWEALRLYLRDAVGTSGAQRVILPLAGDLPSSLLAVLAVDALGARNVIGLLCERPDALTPKAEAEERDRCALARQVADRLGIRTVEHAGADLSHLLDRPVAQREIARVRQDIEAYCLMDAARAFSALAVCPLTKTDFALRADAVAARPLAALAPFGDVYLTELEFLARARNRASNVLPAALVALSAVEASMREVVAAAVDGLRPEPSLGERIGAALGALEPAQIDGVLEAHVDQNRSFEDIPLAARAPESTALLLMIVRRGERARRRLPEAPIVSSRSFADRAWPGALAWSDTGRRGREPATVDGLVDAELQRIEESGEAYGERARDELAELLGDFLGMSPEQLGELFEGGPQAFQENLTQLEEQVQRALERMEREGINPFAGGLGQLQGGGMGDRYFSQN